MNIVIYGKPQIASDSEKTIISWTKKEVITHSASYEGWRHDILKQLRFKYRNKIEENSNILFKFNLNSKESKERLFECTNDILKCMAESKMFKGMAVVTPKISQEIIDGCPNVEIIF